MKKIFFIFLFLFIPYDSFAQLDVYLSSQNLLYGKDVWTSADYPHTDSSKIQVERLFHREEFSSEYQRGTGEIKDLIDDLFSSLSSGERQARYNSLMAFDTQQFSQYLAIALSADTQMNISDKKTFGDPLTPFESTFDACAIGLTERQTIVKNLIEDIHVGVYTDVNTLQYSDIRFGDCIIPFPDVRRTVTNITDSFPSNKLIAQSLGGNPLRFGALEDSVNLFSLAGVSLDGSYVGVQDNNLLNLQSTRVEQDTVFEKEIGASKVLYVHQNHYKNIYKDIFITGNNATGYRVGGGLYNENHPLFIQSSDSETKRTLSGWQEIEQGIYTKILIQEDTFDLVGGVYIPKQNVGVTTYYAIIYNYDTTAPQCPTTLFSHENTGNENFIFPENPWFGTTKYGFFVCLDEESGCSCDSSSVGCFIRDDRVFSIPQEIPYSGTFQYRFWNNVGLSQVCSSPVEQKIFYDKTNPDMNIILPGVPQASLVREYVNNAGVLYDGTGVEGKKFYHIKNQLHFQADESIDIQLQLYDPYDSTKTGEGVSGLGSYNLSISRFENNSWVKKIQEDHVFANYNPQGTLQVQDSHTINFQTFDDIEDIFTKIGKYQVYIDFYDAAGNQSRIILHFDIVSGDIDIAKSVLETMQRNTVYADNNSYYTYSLALKDEYFNPVAGKTILNVEQSCVGISPCSELQFNMSGATPSGGQALEIYNIDGISDMNGVVHFSVKSRVPGIFTESFIVEFGDPLVHLRFSAQDNTFLSPFVGILEAKVSGNWVSDKLPVGQLSEYRVRIKDSQSLGYTWTLSDFSSYLQGKYPIKTYFTIDGALDTQADGVYFSGTFMSTLDEEEKHKTLLEIVDGTTSGVIISYSLDGQVVTYPLSSDNLSAEILQLGNTRELENPVKIIGTLQGVGNTHNLLERQNITDLDTYVFRNMLRKNIGKNIHMRENDTTINGVKYIDKTLDTNKLYILKSSTFILDPSIETLVVRNGNILIEDDFNLSGKVIGIVSYIDGGYNKETGFENIGNIYVEPNVTSITAFLYADGGLISTQSGNPISGDISTRNTELQTQLSINGSLFTRNTLAGGKELAGKYMLPGGEMTTDQFLATQYDLYYTRRGSQGCAKDIYGFCDIPEYLIIEYDPRIQSSPPKLFSQ